jgi:hypothetical protein
MDKHTAVEQWTIRQHRARAPTTLGKHRLCRAHFIADPRVARLDVFLKQSATVDPQVRWGLQQPIDSPQRTALILATIIAHPTCLHILFQPAVHQHGYKTVAHWVSTVQHIFDAFAACLLNRVTRARYPRHGIRHVNASLRDAARTRASLKSRNSAVFVTAVDSFCDLCLSTVAALDM